MVSGKNQLGNKDFRRLSWCARKRLIGDDGGHGGVGAHNDGGHCGDGHGGGSHCDGGHGGRGGHSDGGHCGDGHCDVGHGGGHGGSVNDVSLFTFLISLRPDDIEAKYLYLITL